MSAPIAIPTGQTPPTSTSTSTSPATTPTPAPTLAALLPSPGLGKRKREVSHISGIPVAVVLAPAKITGAREVRTHRRIEKTSTAGHMPAAEAEAEAGVEEAEGEWSDDDITVLV
ncbi:unnamed protein product [Cutaneotrichosporon oleaginosum]